MRPTQRTNIAEHMHAFLRLISVSTVIRPLFTICSEHPVFHVKSDSQTPHLHPHCKTQPIVLNPLRSHYYAAFPGLLTGSGCTDWSSCSTVCCYSCAIRCPPVSMNPPSTYLRYPVVPNFGILRSQQVLWCCHTLPACHALCLQLLGIELLLLGSTL